MESEAYEMMESLGEGCFGKVMKCINTKTKEIMAIKVLKDDDDEMDAELKMLHLIRQLDPDSCNIVRFIDDFELNIGRCMAFEMLDRSVISLMQEQNMKPFTLCEIRAMAQQILVALKGLKSLGVMHTDIKADNIMLVNHKSQPFKIKLIDFGLAMHHTDAKLGTVIQPPAFRAPEVTLGLPLSEAVDMWSLGCCLGMGYLGHCLFNGEDYDVMRSIVHLIGTPEQELLESSLNTSNYFVWTGSEWRLKTIQEYQMSTGNCSSMSESWLYLASDLQVVIQRYHPEQTFPELDDRAAFGDLLKKMLHLNPAERITPTEALKHPFITMAHLTDDSPYTQEAKSVMARATTAVQTKSSEDTSDIDLDTDSNEIRSVCVPPPPPPPFLQEYSGFGINPSQPNIDENHRSLQNKEGRSPGEVSKDADWDMDSDMDSSEIRSVCVPPPPPLQECSGFGINQSPPNFDENHRSLQNEEGRSPGEVSKDADWDMDSDMDSSEIRSVCVPPPPPPSPLQECSGLGINPFQPNIDENHRSLQNEEGKSPGEISKDTDWDTDSDMDSDEIRSVCVPPPPPLQECSGFGINPSRPNIDKNHQSLQNKEGRSPGEVSKDTDWDLESDMDSSEIRSVCGPPPPPLQECSGLGINPFQPNIDKNHQSLQNEEGKSPGEISKDTDWDTDSVMDSDEIRSVCVPPPPPLQECSGFGINPSRPNIDENHQSLQNEDGRSPGEVSKSPSSETSERSRTDDESDSAHSPRETQTSAANVQNMYRENNPGKKYNPVKVLGEGNFGMVVKCLNTQTQKMVAVKILKKNQQKTTKREVDMLNFLSQLDPDSNNIVRFIEYFQLNKSPHLVFERLHSSVWKLMVRRKHQPFALSEIRGMTQQLLVALKALKSLGVMHTDIKPENIMLVNHKKNPFKVKLIDFGLARHHSDTKVGTVMQPPAFRSPEVTLGLPLSEAVDMWSLGCCLGQWYLGRYLFSGKKPYARIRNIIHFMGIPEDELLECGLNTRDYFIRTGSEWRLKTVHEYQMSTGICPGVPNKYLELGSDIEDVLIRYHPKPPLHELNDRVAFVDLLKKMIHLNPAKRITPTEALKHPFITMAHLTNDSPYTQEAKSLMTHATTTDKKQ